MGKRKIKNYDTIQDRHVKNITFSKRKKGVIKKAMELSYLCGQDVILAFFNKDNKKLVLYQSTSDFTPLKLNEILFKREFNDKLYEEHTNLDSQTNDRYKPQTFDLVPGYLKSLQLLNVREKGPPKRHWKMTSRQINLSLDSISDKSEDYNELDYMNMRKSQKLDSDQDLEVNH